MTRKALSRAPVDAVDAAVELELEAVAEVEAERLVARERPDRLVPAVRPAEADLVVVAVERLRVGALAVEPALEVVEDRGAVDPPEQRVAGLAALLRGGELLLRDRVEASKLGRAVLERDTLAHEALEHSVDERAAVERVEPDGRLGLAELLDPQDVAEQEAVRAGRVVL
jgi:hypothetical protein